MLSMLQISAIITFPVLATALLAGAVEADGNRRPLAIWIWPVALANGALLLDDFLRALARLVHTGASRPSPGPGAFDCPFCFPGGTLL